ncbi:MAG: OmpA family protein [Cyanobacteria bacterium P01_D01_bin.56]
MMKRTLSFGNIRWNLRLLTSFSGLAVGLLTSAMALAQTSTLDGEPTIPATQKFDITVNSNADGVVTPDDQLTLREAIELTNGTLLLNQLSIVEQQQVSSAVGSSNIRFNLPPNATVIRLKEQLPDLMQPGLVIDGTSQPGYDPSISATAEIEIPIPVVELTPASDVEVLRGLTVVADDMVIRGLSIYGFTVEHASTAHTPPADIFIAHRLPPIDEREWRMPASRFSFDDEDVPPQGVVIENNWLGMPPSEQLPDVPSAFGVSIFNSQGVTVRRNRISYHDGSGVITGARAENSQILENLIVNNGLAGMPDAIRLDGRIGNSLISGNLMCGNDGSGIFLFKPEGAIEISDNDIRFNGGRLRRAAVYLMGNDHQVIDNRITNQKGPGVVVTAFSQGGTTNSQRNIIKNNTFDSLEGLSIDLNTRHHVGVLDFQRGDGPNPVRNSTRRRWETGNSAINSPQFLSPDFYMVDGKVVIQGKADPGSEVQLYQTIGRQGEYGPLSEPLAIVTVDDEGHFSFSSDALNVGDTLSATATDPEYGTSEPAMNTTVLELGGANNVKPAYVSGAIPQCTTPPIPVAVVPEPEIPEPLRLEVPRNVHYGLDEDFINDDSALILDQIAEVMRKYPTIVVDLHGHTDSRASVAYNQDLARRRANNARRYLMQQGITPERMTIRSFGETELLVEETDRVNYARNRRVEFVFEDVRGVDITFVNQESDLQIEP